MTDKFYITTPLYYVNDEPHIGHAYTTILADVIARYHRMFGRRVHFLTGTDEHGQKVASSAAKSGRTPREQADALVVRFKEVWRELGIEYDDFIRTTEERHTRVVAEVLQELFDRGQIYKATYEGWYCIHEERFWTEKDLVDGNCPDCGRPVERLSEDNYYFRMGEHQQWLISHIESHPDFVQPESRRNEVLGFLRRPLGDLCISRPKSRLSWGITLPFDPEYVTYVWFDALLNYVTAVGYRSDGRRFSQWWPADVHLMAKDILTTHAVYWPTMLHACGVEPPKAVFAHGWWLFGETKMSKSLGNVVRPLDLAKVHGPDPFRYFLIREMTLGRDSTFTPQLVAERLNSDLANDLGNLVSRVTNIVVVNFGGRLPELGRLEADDAALRDASVGLAARVRDRVEAMQPNQALEVIDEAVRATNRYLERQAPWVLVKEGKTDRAGTVLRVAAEVLRIVGVLLSPVMPRKCAELLSCLGVSGMPPAKAYASAAKWGALETGTTVKKVNLFPRVEKEVMTDAHSIEPGREESRIPFDQFKRLDMRVALVEAAERVPKADKLLKLRIDVGPLGKRQIVAGVAQWYAPESLVGKLIVVVVNLEPAVIRGVESDGMLMAASDGGFLALLTTDSEIKPGAKIS